MKNFFKKDELKLLWPFYFDALFATMFYIAAAFEVIYFFELGFSLTQIGFLLSALSLSIFIFEIPTGVFADIFGRKKSTIFGFFLSAFAIFMIFFTHNFYLLLVIFFMWGLGQTFISGAQDAWIVDHLKQNKREELVQEFYVKQHSFYSFSLLFSGLIGAWLVQSFGLSIIWIITAASFIPDIILFSLFAKENFPRKKKSLKDEYQGFINHTKESTKYAFNHKVIFSLLVIGAISVFVMAFSDFLTWQPLLRNLGFQEHWFGYLFSGLMVFGIFGPYVAKFIAKKLNNNALYLMYVSLLVFIVLFFVKFTSILWIFVLLFLLYYVISRDLYLPIFQPFFQKHIPSKMRATVGSFNSMISSGMFIVAMPLAGFIADNIGPQNTIFIGAFVMIPVIILYSKLRSINSN